MKMFNKKEISFEEKMAITDLCVKQFEHSVKNGGMQIPLIKAIYDVAVLAVLGKNVDDGISCTKEEGVCNININIDSNKLISIADNVKTRALRKSIKNYDEFWGEILETIRLCNVAISIKAFGEVFPTAEQMGEQMENLKTILDENKGIVESAIRYEGREGLFKKE